MQIPPSLEAMSSIETGLTVIRPVLGLTAYLADAQQWAEQGAQSFFRHFAERVPADQLQFATNSLLTDWEPISPAELVPFGESLSCWSYVTRKLRHFYWCAVADVPNVPGLGFHYTEIDPLRADRTSVLEVTLPLDGSPALLEQLARALLSGGRVAALVGGYGVRINPIRWRQGLAQYFVWSRRYLGLDLQDSTEWAWLAGKALPGSSWLTYVGAPLLEGQEAVSAAVQAAIPPVSVEPVEGGLLIRAGPAPELGDRNAFTLPTASMEVARALRPLLIPEPPALGGPFDAETTLCWLGRLCDPRPWLEAKGAE